MSPPTLAIEAGNLAFDDSVYILYAVSHDGIDAAKVISGTMVKTEKLLFGKIYLTAMNKVIN